MTNTENLRWLLQHCKRTKR